MRYLVISDIHANLEALDAVLGGGARGFDHALVLGDLVGYGADPNAVVDRLRRARAAHVHPRQSRQGRPRASRTARASTISPGSAMQWTHDTLTPENRD